MKKSRDQGVLDAPILSQSKTQARRGLQPDCACRTISYRKRRIASTIVNA
jgi:hypothetical protein